MFVNDWRWSSGPCRPLKSRSQGLHLEGPSQPSPWVPSLVIKLGNHSAVLRALLLSQLPFQIPIHATSLQLLTSWATFSGVVSEGVHRKLGMTCVLQTPIELFNMVILLFHDNNQENWKTYFHLELKDWLLRHDSRIVKSSYVHSLSLNWQPTVSWEHEGVMNKDKLSTSHQGKLMSHKRQTFIIWFDSMHCLSWRKNTFYEHTDFGSTELGWEVRKGPRSTWSRGLGAGS